MLSVRKLLLISVLIPASLVMANTTYETNDGVSPPGSFEEKSNDVMKTSGGSASKSDVIEREEEAPSDKPILDSNPNDETYRVGPIKMPADPSAPQKMESEDKDTLDVSTSPEKKTVPQPNPNKIGE